MSTTIGTLRRKAQTFGNSGLRELMGVFTPWLDLAEAFGKPARNRLFSPLKNLLALLGSSVVCGPLVSGGRSQIPGLARLDRGQGGLAQFVGLLQRPRTVVHDRH